MLTHPTLDKLHELRLSGMAKAYAEQLQMTDIDTLSTEERLALMVDREAIERANRRLATRLRKATLRHPACVEDINYRHPRCLDKSMVTQLITGQWLRQHFNVLITGPTGIGKSWLACAFANKACRELFARLCRLPKDLAKSDLLVLDDFGNGALNDENRRDLLEILDDRYGVRSTLVTSQFPVKTWHELINDPTLADAILDRLVHNAYRMELKGESMRKQSGQLTETGQSDQ